MKLKEGDKVEAKDDEGSYFRKGDTAVVKLDFGEDDKGNIKVLFDRDINAANSYGREQTWDREHFKLVAKGKPKKPTHIIVYDINDKDPIVICYSEEEMKEEVKKILLKESTKQDSVQVFEVSKVSKPKLHVRF